MDNKEYRKYPNIEDAMYKLADIVDMCNDCTDDLTYVQNIPDVKNKITKIKELINVIDKLVIEPKQ